MPIFVQRSMATWSGPSFSSGSPAWTLTQSRSHGISRRSRMNSVAKSIAPSLKYWPNEKLPSISKNVRWYVSSPTSSMSGVRKHFCTVVVSGAGGVSRPRKYGICGCIPADVRSVERSSARGTSEAEGTRRWPFSSKNAWKPSRISFVVRIADGHCRGADPGSRIVGVARKRYRYRLRRLMPVAGLVVLAGIGGAWVGSHQRAAPAATIAAAQGPIGAIAPVATKVVQRPEQLLRDDSPLSHTFTPALLGRSAILVDASTGRVLWQVHAHERRQVASTTKIMTALLALRKLAPHDLVTVDRSVPRVPL